MSLLTERQEVLAGNGMLPLLETPLSKTEVVDIGEGKFAWVEWIELTPQLARKWITEYYYEGQRPTGDAHVEFLAYEMSKHRFNVEGMYLVHYGDRTFQTDGRHRCHAVVVSGETIIVPVVHIRVPHEDDIAKDYYRRDIGKFRSVAQAYSTLNLERDTGLNKSQVAAVGAASSLLISGFTWTHMGGRKEPESRSRGSVQAG